MFYLSALKGGGAERTVVNIVNNLNKNKFEVVLVLLNNTNNDYIDLVSEDVKIRYLECNRIRYGIFKLRKAIVEEKPDLLFSTLINNNLTLLAAKLLTFRKIPTIVREASNRTASGKVSLLNKIITFISYNFFAKEIIALSEGVREDLIYNFKISPRKIRVIYNPVEVDKIRLKSQDKITIFKEKSNVKNIIAVGRLVEAKDYFTLLRAMKIVLNKENVKLNIIGKGILEETLKKTSKDLGIDNSVQFLGFKTNPYKYMRESDLFVLSSKREGFGHVIVEAMAVGVPVISTNCNSGPAEIIKDDKYGVLVPVGDYKTLAKKIVELLRNENLRQYYREIGPQRARDFEAKKIVNKYEKIFIQNM